MSGNGDQRESVQPDYVPELPEEVPSFRTGLYVPLVIALIGQGIVLPTTWAERDFYAVLGAQFGSGVIQILVFTMLLVAALIQKRKAFAKGLAAGAGLAIVANFFLCVALG